MVVAVVSDAAKAVGSTEGMTRAQATSPLWDAWCAQAQADLARATQAVLDRDLPALGEVMESSTFKMFSTMFTSRPPLLYWQPSTLALLHRVQQLRAEGVPCWCTMDAGPQVKVLCAAEHADPVARALEGLAQRVHVLAPGPGLQVLSA
jgi:diphosphomevalonate decarboxylase